MGFIIASCSWPMRFSLPGSMVDVEGEDVGFAVERGFIDAGGGEGELSGGDVEDVVVEYAHAEAVGGDVADAAADAAHAEDADRQLVELSAADGVADALELFGVVDRVL